MAATLKEIAQRVGKSVTTVSRALAGYSDVSEATRAQVRQVAQELGYEPNITARRLQKRRTETLAIVLPTYSPRFSDPFFSEFLAGVGNAAAAEGYDLLVSTRSPGDEEEKAYRDLIRSRRVDAFIVVRTRLHDARIEILKAANFPFAAFGRIEGDNDFLFVDEDSELGLRLVVEHLVKLGHRRLAFLAAPPDLMFARYRLKGFTETLQARGLPVDPELILTGDLSQRHGHQLAGILLDRPDPPTAIVACNDLMALGAMSAVQNRGLKVGYDVSITGFDDIPPAEHAHPSLTTVHQPVYKIGKMVCQMVIDVINGREIPNPQITLAPSLVIRQSSGPVQI
ncbi:MAG: LacI family transcriptional regulator [Chloroflexi bacterium]|nr:MAG: LacI family transcriptional regulator [Chloroflexota bacterium]